MKKASSRSQRGSSKSIKGKHVLQICVLFGVCIWLICQVKYSHDKEFYEKDGKKSMVVMSEIGDGVVKLGRKDLLSGYHNQKGNKKHVDEEEIGNGEEEKERNSKVENGNHEEEEKEEEEEVVEEEDEEDKNKQGEEVAEEDDDDIDEQDQNKSVGDTDKDDESVGEESESGSNENDEEERETNHEDETVDEAREEHYKADDASSAVSHEYRILNTEKHKESSIEIAQENISNADHNTPISADLTNKDFIQDKSKNSTSESSLLENITDSNTTEVKENTGSEDYDESGSNLFSTELTEEADNTLENSISQEDMEALKDQHSLPDARIEGNEEDEEERTEKEKL